MKIKEIRDVGNFKYKQNAGNLFLLFSLSKEKRLTFQHEDLKS